MILQKGSPTFLLIGILSSILFIFLIFSFSPSGYFFHFPSLFLFFPLVFFAAFGFVGFLLKSKVQAIVVGFMFVSFFLLRFFSFTNWFFTSLLILLFAIIEGFLLQKN